MDAILAGERDPLKIVQLRHPRIRASEETILKSLVSDYREEHLFTLRQSLKAYRYYQELIQEVDVQVKQMMQRLPSKAAEGEEPPQGSKRRVRRTPWRNEPPQLREDLYRAFGVDLAEIPGINSLTTQMLLTEIGPNLDRFPTAAAFCSWLRLCPDPRISGGQVLPSRTRPTKNRAALRMKARMGTPKAMTATAHKLARIIFHMITTKQPYDATIFQKQEERRRHQKSARLHAQAKELGFQLIPINVVP